MCTVDSRFSSNRLEMSSFRDGPELREMLLLAPWLGGGGGEASDRAQPLWSPGLVTTSQTASNAGTWILARMGTAPALEPMPGLRDGRSETDPFESLYEEKGSAAAGSKGLREPCWAVCALTTPWAPSPSHTEALPSSSIAR